MESGKEIEKFIISTTKYMLVFFGLYALVIIALAAVPPFTNKIPNLKNMRGGNDCSLLRFSEANFDANTWIFGSSHAFRGFDPRIFEENDMSIQIFGSASQHLLNSRWLMQEFLNENQPKFIFVELDYALMNDTRKLEATYSLMSNKSLSSESFRMVADANNIGLWNSYFYHLVHQQIFPLEQGVQENNELDIYVKGGFLETSHKRNLTLNNSVKQKSVPIKTENLDFYYACRIVEICKENDVELVFYSTPQTRAIRANISNMNQVDSLFNAFAVNNKCWYIGTVLEETYTSIGLIDSVDLFDSNHLTQTGVCKYNNYFMDKLIEFGLVQKANN